METLYIARDVKLEREAGSLLLRPHEGPKRRIPVRTLKHVVICGEAGMTTAVLALLGRARVRVTTLDWHGNFVGAFEPAGAPAAGRVRLAQAAHALAPEKALTLARLFVSGSLANLIANLRYRAYRGVDLADDIAALQTAGRRLDAAASTAELMGIEGGARAAYFAAWPKIDPRLVFGPRRRRPPNNRINCLISWFNGLAYALARNELAMTHLDNCISFLHAPTEARASLALDLAEIFKPALCDALIFELVLRNRLEDAWFAEADGVCRLTEAGRQATLTAWTARTENDSEGPSGFRALMRAEALSIERHVLGIADYKPWRRRV